MSAYATSALIIATGCCFALLCFFLILIEFIVKVLAVPVIFSIAMASLAYGLMQRKLFGPVIRFSDK
jgi:hypothetical protein